MKVAVIGAGWAGAAAAYYLRQAACQVSVFEAARQVGGRARRVQSTKLQRTIDNGQHILLGAYSETLALMHALELDTKQAFYRCDLDIQSADGSFRLKNWPLKAPLHLLGAMLSAKGISWNERIRLARFTRYLQKRNWQTPPAYSVLQLLREQQQSAALIQNIWRPLCIAALNTPLELACAQLFANVLRDSLGGSRADSQFLVALNDMSALWAEAALADCNVHLGTHVHALQYHGEQWLINQERFDACVIATPAYATYRIVRDTPLPNASSGTHELWTAERRGQWFAAMQTMRYRPIATLYLQLESPWLEASPILMLHEYPERCQVGQWLFNHHALAHSFAGDLLSVVISDATLFEQYSRETMTAAIIEQLKEQTRHRHPIPTIVASELIIEKRATFEATPTTVRPDLRTPWPSLALAGDWLSSDYPGVLEGAVRSGKAAANYLLTHR